MYVECSFSITTVVYEEILKTSKRECLHNAILGETIFNS